jgi:hypothetical protein
MRLLPWLDLAAPQASAHARGLAWGDRQLCVSGLCQTGTTWLEVMQWKRKEGPVVDRELVDKAGSCLCV